LSEIPFFLKEMFSNESLVERQTFLRNPLDFTERSRCIASKMQFEMQKGKETLRDFEETNSDIEKNYTVKNKKIEDYFPPLEKVEARESSDDEDWKFDLETNSGFHLKPPLRRSARSRKRVVHSDFLRWNDNSEENVVDCEEFSPSIRSSDNSLSADLVNDSNNLYPLMKRRRKHIIEDVEESKSSDFFPSDSLEDPIFSSEKDYQGNRNSKKKKKTINTRKRKKSKGINGHSKLYEDEEEAGENEEDYFMDGLGTLEVDDPSCVYDMDEYDSDGKLVHKEGDSLNTETSSSSIGGSKFISIATAAAASASPVAPATAIITSRNRTNLATHSQEVVKKEAAISGESLSTNADNETSIGTNDSAQIVPSNKPNQITLFEEQLEKKRKPNIPQLIKKYSPVPMDSSGKPIMPIVLRGGLKITNLGTIVTDRPNFHSKRYIWPVGFRSERFYSSMTNIQAKCLYISEIVDNDIEPEFVVICPEDPENPIEIRRSTASGVWAEVARRYFEKRKGETGMVTNTQLSGPEMFGFGHPTIAKLIQEMPGAELCSQYVMQQFVPAGTRVKFTEDSSSNKETNGVISNVLSSSKRKKNSKSANISTSSSNGNYNGEEDSKRKRTLPDSLPEVSTKEENSSSETLPPYTRGSTCNPSIFTNVNSNDHSHDTAMNNNDNRNNGIGVKLGSSNENLDISRTFSNNPDRNVNFVQATQTIPTRKLSSLPGEIGVNIGTTDIGNEYQEEEVVEESGSL